MAERDKATAGLVIGTGAAIAAALALMQRRVQAASPEGVVSLDEATMNLLIAITQVSENIPGKLDDITSAIEHIYLTTQGWVPNANSIRSFRVQCPAAATAYQLPDVGIPDDMQLQIKGWPTNGNLIWVGESRAAATNINQVWPLLPNEAIGYRVKNANVIWISAVVAGEWAVCTVEQKVR